QKEANRAQRHDQEGNESDDDVVGEQPREVEDPVVVDLGPEVQQLLIPRRIFQAIYHAGGRWRSRFGGCAHKKRLPIYLSRHRMRTALASERAATGRSMLRLKL